MKTLLLLVILTFTAAVGYTAVPYQFFPEQAAEAAHVNANFDYLNTEVGKNKTKSLKNEADIASLESDLFTVSLLSSGTSSDLTAMETTVDAMSTDVTTLEDAVIANTEDIGLLDSAINAIESALSSIESAITDLDTRVTTLEEATPSEACLNINADASPIGELITYTYQSSIAGQQLTINAVDYTIVKVPVKDMVSGKTYILTAPFKTIGGRLTTGQIKDKCFGNMSISGFPAQLEMYERTTFEINHLEDGLVRANLDSFTERLWIKVDSMVIFISVPQPTYTTVYSFDLVDNNYDGSAVDTSGIERDTTFINNLDTFIDYIKVEEVVQ